MSLQARITAYVGPAGSLRRKSITAVGWMWAQGLIRGLLGLVISGLLARMLGAGPYGQYAVVVTTFQIACYLADAGVGAALVQRAELTERDIHSTHTVASLQGVAVGLIYALAAYPISLKLHEPAIFPALVFIALIVPINSLGVTSMALLRRDLKHRENQWCTFAGFLIGQIAIAIPLAHVGFGLWALVVSLAVQQTTQTILMYLMVRHPTKFLLYMDKTSRRFTWSILTQNIALSLLNSLDQLTLAYYAPDTTVGLYNRAKWSLDQPTTFVTGGLQTVGLASSSRVQNDAKKLRLIAIATSAAAATASGILLLVVHTRPDLWIHYLLGPKFSGAILIVPVLAFERVFAAILLPLNAVLNGAGHPELEAKSLIICVPLAAVAFVLAAPHGAVVLAETLVGVTAFRLAVQIAAVTVVIRRLQAKNDQLAAAAA